MTYTEKIRNDFVHLKTLAKHNSLWIAEIWIADHKIKIENLHNLSFEKTQNMIMKQILGVHGKTPNLAIHAELLL
jgi:hypothetical protein